MSRAGLTRIRWAVLFYVNAIGLVIVGDPQPLAIIVGGISAATGFAVLVLGFEERRRR